MIDDGFKPDMPEPDYRAAEGVNYSRLKRLQQSPAHVHVPFHPTPAMMLGTIVDNLVFENDIGANFVVKTWDARTKEGRDLSERARQEGVTVIDKDLEGKAMQMAYNVTNHPVAKDLLSNAVYQLPAFATCPETGLPLKALFDFCDPGSRGLQGDLKTTACDLSETRNWEREVFNRGYHIQMAHYLGIRAIIEETDVNDDWYWICVENSEPYGVRVFEADRDIKAFSRSKWLELLHRWKEVDRGKLWGEIYAPIIETISIPNWVR